MRLFSKTDPKDDDEDEISNDSSDDESSDVFSEEEEEESSDDELKPCPSCQNYGCDDEECKRDNTNR